MGEGMGRTETNIDAHPITGAPVPPVGWACFAFSFSPFTSSSSPFMVSFSPFTCSPRSAAFRFSPPTLTASSSSLFAAFGTHDTHERDMSEDERDRSEENRMVSWIEGLLDIEDRSSSSRITTTRDYSSW